MALSAHEITVRRGGRVLLEDASLEVTAGGALLVGGANGTGKTSLLRVLAGLAEPRRGTVRRDGPAAFVPERVALTGALRPLEWLDRVRALRGLAPVDWPEPAERAGIDPGALSGPSSSLSKGTLQKVLLLEAIGARPAVLLLDEPLSGLDAAAAAWVTAELARVRSEGTAVVATDHSGGLAAGLDGAGRAAIRGGALVS